MDFRWPPPPSGRPLQFRSPSARGPSIGRPALPPLPTELVGTPHGVELERLVSGSGADATVFAHGIASSISEVRPLGLGVAGRKVYFHFRGHGCSAAPVGRWTYLDLARDLRAVADLSAATRAVGVGLGAGALCRLLADNPTRFDRVVFVLPAAFDTPCPEPVSRRLAALLEAVEASDVTEVAELISQETPPSARYSVPVWSHLRQRLDQLMRDGLAPQLRYLPEQVAVPASEALRLVKAPALVIGCAGDEVHRVEVAERLAALIPRADLVVYDRPGALWSNRADLRDRIATFVNADSF